MTVNKIIFLLNKKSYTIIVLQIVIINLFVYIVDYGNHVFINAKIIIIIW